MLFHQRVHVAEAKWIMAEHLIDGHSALGMLLEKCYQCYSQFPMGRNRIRQIYKTEEKSQMVENKSGR